MSDRPLPPPGDRLDATDAAQLAAALTPEVPSPARADALKARILAAARDTRAAEPARIAATFGFKFIAASERVWETRGLGIEMCTLHEDEHSRAILIRLKPGGVLPAHTHQMNEESLMLEGDAWIGDERYMTAGDYHFVPAGVTHPDLRSPAGCVVYVRGERHYRPKITPTLVQRMVRSFLGRD